MSHAARYSNAATAAGFEGNPTIRDLLDTKY